MKRNRRTDELIITILKANAGRWLSRAINAFRRNYHDDAFYLRMVTSTIDRIC
jgi:hypothetical protein